MPRRTTNQEVEIKLPVSDAPAFTSRLKQLRARLIVPRTFESNTLYDGPSQPLRKAGRLIRIRLERPATVPGGRPGRNRSIREARSVLTYKGPAQSPESLKLRRGSANTAARFKIREEIELTIGDAAQMDRVLRALGLAPTFRYDKFRTTYALPGIDGLRIEYDETPIGLFIELEGPPAAIDRAAMLLGYMSPDYVTASYGALYLEHCRRHGRKPRNMLFSPTKSLR